MAVRKWSVVAAPVPEPASPPTRRRTIPPAPPSHSLAEYGSPRHMMPFRWETEGSTCVSMTWQAIHSMPYPAPAAVAAVLGVAAQVEADSKF